MCRAVRATNVSLEIARSRITFKAGRLGSTTCSPSPTSVGSLLAYPTDRQVSTFGVQGPRAPRAPAQGARRVGHITDASPAVGVKCGNAGISRRQIHVGFLLGVGRPPIKSHATLRFVSFHPPSSPEDALADAERVLEYRHDAKDGMYSDRDLGGPL